MNPLSLTHIFLLEKKVPLLPTISKRFLLLCTIQSTTPLPPPPNSKQTVEQAVVVLSMLDVESQPHAPPALEQQSHLLSTLPVAGRTQAVDNTPSVEYARPAQPQLALADVPRPSKVLSATHFPSSVAHGGDDGTYQGLSDSLPLPYWDEERNRASPGIGADEAAVFKHQLQLSEITASAL